MKKQLLCTALSSLLCYSVYADNAQQPAVMDDTAPPAAQTIQDTAPPTQPVMKSTLAAAPLALPVIDCNYAIPSTSTTIDKSILLGWAGKAAVQTFEFNPTTINEQLEKLKNCFTDQGWQSYYDALVQSGNLESIKTHLLNVTSKVDGDIKINPIKDNQWKITLPMKVLYQNDKESFKQDLSVDLLIGRKMSGGLGIMQVVASPKDAASTPEAAVSAAH